MLPWSITFLLFALQLLVWFVNMPAFLNGSLVQTSGRGTVTPSQRDQELQKENLKLASENLELRFQLEQSNVDLPRLKVDPTPRPRLSLSVRQRKRAQHLISLCLCLFVFPESSGRYERNVCRTEKGEFRSKEKA